MFEIKVSPEKKKEIIEELEKQDWSWIEEEFGNDDNQTQQEQTQIVVTQAKKQENEISTNMWESRLEKFYGVIGRAPYNLKKRLIMKREEIVNAISNRMKQRDNRKENMEK